MKSEADVQKKILDYLKSKGAYAVKVIASNHNGAPDIIACVGGSFVGIEVKKSKSLTGAPKLTMLQSHNIKAISKAGGRAFSATSVSDAERELESPNQRILKRAFISGKVSGLDRKECLEKFARSEFILQRKGYETWSPVKHIPETTNWKAAMKICMQALVNCDVVYFQSDWQSSLGSRFEHEAANVMGMTCIYEDRESVEYYEKNAKLNLVGY